MKLTLSDILCVIFVYCVGSPYTAISYARNTIPGFARQHNIHIKQKKLYVLLTSISNILLLHKYKPAMCVVAMCF